MNMGSKSDAHLLPTLNASFELEALSLNLYICIFILNYIADEALNR